MSGDAGHGYLTRLVARMTDEPALRPRVRSRFEIGRGELRDLEAVAETRREARPARDQPRADRPVAASPDSHRSDRAHAPAPAPLPPQDLAGLMRRLTEGNPAGAAGRGVAEPSITGSGVAQPAATPRVQAPPDLGHATGPAAVPPHAAVAPDRDPEAAAPPNARAAPDPDPRPFRAVARPLTAADDGEGPPTRHAIRVTARSDAMETPGRAERREPDVVTVHIGRVEVRAIGAAPASGPPSPRPAPGRRPLSLDDYLAAERRS